MQRINGPRYAITGLVGALLAVGTVRALDVTWNFDGASPLAASIGSGTMAYYDPSTTSWGPIKTQFGTPASLGLPAFPNAASGGVMRFPATAPNEGYQVFPGGALASTSAYTMIWDFLSPPSADGHWRDLLQTSLANNNDGDFFIQNSASGGIGILGSYQGSIAPNTWNRIALTRSADGTMSKYINGVRVGVQSSTDPRFTLGSSYLLFADEDGETAPGYVSSYRYVDSVLSDEQVRLLGNVSSAGATVAGPTIPGPSPPPLPPLFGRTQIMGHRGGGTLAPENTLAAIEKGFEVGIDLVEIDLHLTADGHAVVLHDDTLDRTTNGTGPIANLTLAQVKQLDAGSWFGPEYAGAQVPTLTEVLQLTKGRARTLLDVKVPPTQAFRDALYAAIVASGASLDDIWVWPSSGNYPSDPRFGTAEVQLLSSVPGDLSDTNLQTLKASGIDGLSATDGSLTQEIINAFHRNGMWVDAYTVNSPARMEELIAMGVDSIETDRPDLMADIIFSGDADRDFDVDGSDFLALQRQSGFGNNLAAWRATFGNARGIPAAASAAVEAAPEPSSAVLALAAGGAIGALAKRPRRVTL